MSCREGRDHCFCAQIRHIFAKKVFGDLYWILIKVSPSLGSSLLMVEKLDPRVADTSSAEAGARAKLGGLQEGRGSSTKWFVFFVFCVGCLPSSLWTVPCSFQVRDLSCLSRGSSAFAPVLAGRSPWVLWGDSVPLACVMGGEEGASALSLPAPSIAGLSCHVWLQASVAAPDFGALGRALPTAGYHLLMIPAPDVP